mgnify:FL=1
MTADDERIDVEAVDALDDVDSIEQIGTDALPDPTQLDLSQLGPLIGLARSILESLTDGEDDPSAGKPQALLHLLNLIGGVLETTDADEVLSAVDLDDLDEVVDPDSLPEALESGALGDAVELTNLRKLIEFGQLWQTVDLTELMGSKGEISDTVSELTGDNGEGGLFDGLEMEDFTGGDGEMGALTDPEMIQAATQAQLDDAVDGFRDLLVETHARLDALREANQARFDGVDQPSSRNPTAVSTLTTHRGPPKAASQVSTVPRRVRHSTGPSRRRIYGRRFDQLMKETHADAAESDEEPVDEEQTNGRASDQGGDDR